MIFSPIGFDCVMLFTAYILERNLTFLERPNDFDGGYFFFFFLKSQDQALQKNPGQIAFKKEEKP